MSIYVTLRNKLYQHLIYPYHPQPRPLERPTFVIGCGRSGTTILGRTLSHHPQIAYLNEPRHIWHYEPRADIWSQKAQRYNGRLQLTAQDVNPKAAQAITRAFAVEMRLQQGQQLVEKLPVNSFRIPYLLGMFPDARFIHMVRNGIEVAHSIAKRVEAGRWFRGTKWELLVAYAEKQGKAELVKLCTTPFRQGLLEWRLNVNAARQALQQLPPERSLEIRYSTLIDDPLTVCSHVETFMNLDHSEEMRQFATTHIARRSPPQTITSLTPEREKIAGALLMELGYLQGEA